MRTGVVVTALALLVACGSFGAAGDSTPAADAGTTSSGALPEAGTTAGSDAAPEAVRFCTTQLLCDDFDGVALGDWAAAGHAVTLLLGDGAVDLLAVGAAGKGLAAKVPAGTGDAFAIRTYRRDGLDDIEVEADVQIDQPASWTGNPVHVLSIYFGSGTGKIGEVTAFVSGADDHATLQLYMQDANSSGRPDPATILSLAYGTWHHLVLEAGLIGIEGTAGVASIELAGAKTQAPAAVRFEANKLADQRTYVWAGIQRSRPSESSSELTVHVDNIVGTPFH